MPRVFELWRRWLSRRAFALDRSVRTRLLARSGTTPPTPTPGLGRLRSHDTRWLLAGTAALVVGGIGRVGLAAAGSPRLEALLAAGFVVVLAGARLAILTYWMRRSGGESASATAAWSRGSVAWVIAIDPALAAVAWAVSAFVTHRTLVERGVPASTSRTGVAAAWGAHAVAVAAVWLATNAWVALIAG